MNHNGDLVYINYEYYLYYEYLIVITVLFVVDFRITAVSWIKEIIVFITIPVSLKSFSVIRK